MERLTDKSSYLNLVMLLNFSNVLSHQLSQVQPVILYDLGESRETNHGARTTYSVSVQIQSFFDFGSIIKV